MKRAIEGGFPIVEINRLAVPERNSFKPIYQMHKWFARRASCVFRAILLGCLKPAGTDIMTEFRAAPLPLIASALAEQEES